MYHIEGIASQDYSAGHCVFFKESHPHKTVSSFSVDRLLVHIPSWLGWKFFGLYTLYLMPVVSSWVYNFLFIWRPGLKSSSLVVILTFCTAVSISPFFSLSPVMKFVIISKKSVLTLSLSGAFRALCKYQEHDPGNFFSPRNGKSSTCQSVILSINSYKGTQSGPCLNPSGWRGGGGEGVKLLNNCDQL